MHSYATIRIFTEEVIAVACIAARTSGRNMQLRKLSGASFYRAYTLDEGACRFLAGGGTPLKYIVCGVSKRRC